MNSTDNPYESSGRSSEQVITPANNRPHSFVFGMVLLVAAIAWCFGGMFGLTYFLLGSSDSPLDFSSPIFYGPVVHILYNLAIAFGAVGILRRGSLFAARVTTCLAMVPLFGPFYVVGFFLGIWGLMGVLRDPKVVDSINATAAH